MEEAVQATVPQGLCDEILQATLAVLYRDKGVLRRCWSYFDADMHGTVNPEDFRRGLDAFKLLDMRAVPLNEEQVDIMVANLNRNKDGLIEYENFLDSLQVVCLD